MNLATWIFKVTFLGLIHTIFHLVTVRVYEDLRQNKNHRLFYARHDQSQVPVDIEGMALKETSPSPVSSQVEEIEVEQNLLCICSC